MPISELQREERRGFLGSSDVPAVVGVDPWKGPHDVFLEKVLPVDEIPTSEAIEIGNDFEIPLLEWAARELGKEINVNVRTVHPEHGALASSHDALVVGQREGMEAKTSSMSGEYGAEGTDEVPERVLVQAHWQMATAGLDLVHVPVLLASFDRLQRRLYVVKRNERLIEILLRRGLEFWNGHVIPGVPPSSHYGTASMEVLKRIRRLEGAVAEVDPAVAEAYDLARAAHRESSEALETAKAALLNSLGDSEIGDSGDPDRVYTYFEQTKTVVSERQLRRARPEIHKQFSRTSSFRVLRKVKRGV